MSRAVLLPLLVLAGLLLPEVVQAQSETKPRSGPTTAPAAPSPLGQGASSRERVRQRIAIGEQAPDFELTRLDGKPQRLSGLRGEWVVLIFADRRDSLVNVEPVARAVAEFGVRTLAVCYDKTHVLARHLRGHDLPYMPLADPTGEIVALYGLWDDRSNASLPGFVLVNPRGEVRLAVLGDALPAEDTTLLVQYAVQGR
jgi:peroxiredoxin